MKWWGLVCIFTLAACNSESDMPSPATASKNSATGVPQQSDDADTSVSFVKDTTAHESYTIPEIKKPSGVYQFVFPYDSKTKILHTIAFYPTTFRLQEEYLGKNDSIVITEGTWAPSQGFIWVYKEQLARGRYTWKGDSLQYYSPRLNQKFSLSKLIPAPANTVWQEKKKGGSILFGVGNEPFWSVEVTKQDSIVLNMPDWTQSLRAKITNTDIKANQTIYNAVADSLQVTVYPYFCSDGMSDFIYSNKVSVNYKGKTYHGCGQTF